MFHNSKKETILKEEIQDNMLAIYLEDEQINYIPEKDSGYTLDITKSSCNNGVTISFDYNTWSVKTNYSNYTNTDNTRVKCSLYFKKRTFAEAVVDCGALSKDAGTCIKENYYLTDEVVDDETVDNNLRFIGADPNNYVWFNDELWRIIGVMNNIDDGTGKKETRLKIIRNEPYSTGMAWSTDSSNDWTTASLQEELNSMYLNDIQSPYKEMIENVVWNLGGQSSETATDIFYTSERGTKVYDTRPTVWIGSIGLMYPSDYGYATGGGSNMNRNICLTYNLNQWGLYQECSNNSWLYNNSYGQWTLTPYSTPSNYVFVAASTGFIGWSVTNNPTFAVLPVTYLKSFIKIIDGAGTKEQPYKLSL